MRDVWEIGKRRFGGDWGRRLWLFDRLIWTVLGYGAEIWGWEEREEVEKLEERYLRWVLDRKKGREKDMLLDIYGQRRITEGKVKRKSRDEGVEI